MQALWKLIPGLSREGKVVNKQALSLAKKLDLDPLLINWLFYLGHDSEEKLHEFFYPSLKNLHNPFLMKDMSKAVARLKRVFENNEKILIIGDYDVDGTTSTALLLRALRPTYQNIDYYIPDRYKEGYGVSIKAINFAKDNNFSLIISVDCGINAFEPISLARESNIDFIVIDHHTPEKNLPPATAILNPKQPDDSYPFKELSGCGVALKFLHALVVKKIIPVSRLNESLDLVAMSIAADIVPIVGENRILAYYGLKKLNSHPIPGLEALIKAADIKSQINIGTIGFVLGPRINAAGRLEHGSLAVELFLKQETEQALELAKRLSNLNSQRQKLQQDIVKAAEKQVRANKSLQKANSLVLFSPEWNKGVVGIAASKIVELFFKPTIILTRSEGKITGSARSVPGFNIYNAIYQCRHLLTNFGGHDFAAGLSLEEQNLQNFIICFESSVSQTITPQQKRPLINLAGKLHFYQLSVPFVRTIEKLQPFGPGNPRPVFYNNEVRDTGYSRLIGKASEHVLFQLEDPSNIVLTALAFNMSDKVHDLINQPYNMRPVFSIAFTPELVQREEESYVQLLVKDIKFRKKR